MALPVKHWFPHPVIANSSMWSRPFLLVGLVSSVLAAAAAIGLTAIALWAIESTIDSGMLVSLLVTFGIPAMVIYPMCWYLIIFRHRDYAPIMTWLLIAYTYCTCGLLLISALFAVTIYQAVMSKSEMPPSFGSWTWTLQFMGGWVMVGLFAVIGAIMFSIPYVALAGPLVFAQRALLLGWFGGGAEPAGCDHPQDRKL